MDMTITSMDHNGQADETVGMSSQIKWALFGESKALFCRAQILPKADFYAFILDPGRNTKGVP